MKLFFAYSITLSMLLSMYSCSNDDDTTAPIINPSATIDQFVDSLRTVANRQAMAIAVVNANGLIYAKGYGLANAENALLADENTPFLVASISKTITGVALMQLVEAGVIGLDTDINTYLDFDIHNPIHPDIPITSRQLLSHTSGILDDYYLQIAFESVYNYNMDPDRSLAQFCVDMLDENGSQYDLATFSTTAPGEAYNYSNVGIALAGLVVEQAINLPFYEYCQIQIFEPLQMNSTSWRLADFDLDMLAMPYDDSFEPYQHYTFDDYPNGGLRTSVTDLSKFLRMIINNGVLGEAEILLPETVEMMRTIYYPDLGNGAENQGLAFNKEDFGTVRMLFGHLGGERGVNTVMYYDETSKVGAIIFDNKDYIEDEDPFEVQLGLFLKLLEYGEGQ